MTASDAREKLCSALGRTVKRHAARHPELELADLMKTIGIVAGAAVAEVVPPGNPELDLRAGNLLGEGYAHGVAFLRMNRAS